MTLTKCVDKMNVPTFPRCLFLPPCRVIRSVPAYLPHSVTDQLVEKHITGYRFSDMSEKMQIEILLKEMTPVWYTVDDTTSASRGNFQKSFWLTRMDTLSVRSRTFLPKDWICHPRTWLKASRRMSLSRRDPLCKQC